MNKQEWEAVRQLGEKIGYGNMMEIASSLWRNKLLKDGISFGAFIPTIEQFVLKKHRKTCEKSSAIYDSWYKRFYPAPTKTDKQT